MKNRKRIPAGTEIAFQGEKGAYSEEAILSSFGESVTPRAYRTLIDVFATMENGVISYGVVPVENSSEGSINETYDLLLDSKLKVCGEVNLRVVHCLVAKKNTKLSDIEIIYSHPQALAQCSGFIRKMGIEPTPTYDTAGSVPIVKGKRLRKTAAIASSRAAEIYGMNILARGIEDNPMNFTRFFILSTRDSLPTGKDKTSIIFSVKHKSGSLYGALTALAKKNINLTKIESRPTKQKPWEYNFYLDFEGHRKEKTIACSLKDLKQESIFVKILGSYPMTEIKT